MEINTVFNGLMSAQVESMNEMVISQRVQLESAVKKLVHEKLQSALDLEEAVQGTKLQVTLLIYSVAVAQTASSVTERGTSGSGFRAESAGNTGRAGHDDGGELPQSGGGAQ